MSGKTSQTRPNEHVNSHEKGNNSKERKHGFEKNLWDVLMLNDKTKEILDDIKENKLRIESNIELSWVVWSLVSIDLENKWEFKMFIPDDIRFMCMISGELGLMCVVSDKNSLTEYMGEKWVKWVGKMETCAILSYLLWDHLSNSYLTDEDESKKIKFNFYNDEKFRFKSGTWDKDNSTLFLRMEG